jgi:hypothetical protein
MIVLPMRMDYCYGVENTSSGCSAGKGEELCLLSTRVSSRHHSAQRKDCRIGEKHMGQNEKASRFCVLSVL